MNGRKFISGFFILAGALLCAEPCAIFAFTPVSPKYNVSAVVSVGGGIIFDFFDVLPTQAFFGKNVVIPVPVTVSPAPGRRVEPEREHRLSVAGRQRRAVDVPAECAGRFWLGVFVRLLRRSVG